MIGFRMKNEVSSVVGCKFTVRTRIDGVGRFQLLTDHFLTI